MKKPFQRGFAATQYDIVDRVVFQIAKGGCIALAARKETYRFSEYTTHYYHPGTERDYIVMGQAGIETFPAAVHEYMHLMMRHAVTGTNDARWGPYDSPIRTEFATAMSSLTFDDFEVVQLGWK
jgi:hypothetical protein